ncbi:hypothetical protein [Microcoleus sp. FACHB-68]|uniref:hypothetical protein n=1 Tax=Microcoleus sp. FACHB-68 TaxID=2692826 RepID=UPI001684B75C|nr:hypothetical protein [Microcoleus sp. FACHB-68]MBD1937660.1 hypothetical protein [Microcoleus sp. FACHB-68]
MDYLTWNDLIASHFFQAEMAGSTVYLYVTEELIIELGQTRGADLADFIKAVKTGPIGVHGKGICQKALQSMNDWKYRRGRKGYPLYVGYLALFVLAAGIEEDFAPHAYYPRLRRLLGEEHTSGQYRDFDQMGILWDDLGRWANEDKLGEVGIFNINIAGNWIHVGRPIAQTLLTEEERRSLPYIFASADLDPTAPPSEEVIAFLLVKHGGKYLRNQTLKLLKESSDTEELRQALLGRIIDELREWDGTAEVPSSDGSKIYGFLKLCCNLDESAGRATLSLRCTTKHEFPEDDLFLSLEDNSQSFSCYEDGGSWSSQLISESDGKLLVASEFDWLKDLQLRSADSRWCFRLPPSPIRVFVEGDTEGLPDLVEVRQLPTQKTFYLAAYEDCWELLEKWGKSECKDFETLRITEGLPSRWRFFKAALAYSDKLIKREYPVLAFPTTVRLELRGIRLDRGNKFFKFAPPKVVLQGKNESIKLYWNDKLLHSKDVADIYELPTESTLDKQLHIEARRGKEILRRCSLSWVEEFSSGSCLPTQKLDCFGNFQKDVDNNTVGVRGAWIEGVDCPPFNFNTLLPIQDGQKIVFVGKETGQIVTCPDEALPIDWYPVWAIAKGRLLNKAMFCGSSLKESEPHRSTCNDKRKLQQWKEILWDSSGRTLPPMEDNRLKDLWKKFQKEAKRVRI